MSPTRSIYKPVTDVTLKQLQDFVEVQSEDEVIHALWQDNAIATYFQNHLRILHEIIIGDLTVTEAEEELRELEL